MKDESGAARQATVLGWAAAGVGLAALVAGVVALVAGVAWVAIVAGALAAIAGLATVEAARRIVDGPGSDPADTGGSPLREVGVIDPLTGAFNRRYFELAVRSRILAARRQLRPLAVVVFEVVGTKAGGNGAAAPLDPVPVARRIQRVLRECDTVCHLGDARFGFVLEDTNPDGAIWAVERLRRALTVEPPEQIHRAGVACYPAHAFEAEDLLAKAEGAVVSARDWPQDRIEVALAD